MAKGRVFSVVGAAMLVALAAGPAGAVGRATTARPTPHHAVGAQHLTKASVSRIAAAAGGPPTVNVGVDAGAPPGHNWEYTHYFPETGVSVPQGGLAVFAWNPDSINGLHTVTLVPNGMTEAQVRAAAPAATKDTDNGETGVVEPASNSDPTRTDCSTPDNQVACPFDGTSVLSSGAAPTSSGAVFAVQLASNVAPGDYTYVCLIHSGMSGKLHVVPAGQPASTAPALAAAAAAEYGQLNNIAQAAETAANQNVVSTANADGTRTWTVQAGLSADDVEILQFLPRSLPIRKGDKVHYVSSSTNEIHTVTFPLGDAAFSVSPFGSPQCEVANGPDVPADFSGPSPNGCTAPNSVEQPFILGTQGEQHAIASERTIASSGLITSAPDFTASGAASTHDYTFGGNGSYYYTCVVHQGMGAVVSTQGYRVVGANGSVFTYGGLDFAGAGVQAPGSSPVVATVATSDRQGYWLVTADGHTQNFGTAPAVGSLTSPPARPIVAAVATGDDGGLYLAGSDGGVFTLGDAVFGGSLGGTPLNAPIVAITADRFFAGGGYTLIAADGGTFAFGTDFIGSLATVHLVAPIVAAFEDVSSAGLVLVAADGGVFGLGRGHFLGSLGGMRINAPIVGIAASADPSAGYRLLGRDGGVYAFGPGAPFVGSAAGQVSGPAVGIMAS